MMVESPGGLVFVAEADDAIDSWVAPTPEISTRNWCSHRQRGDGEQGAQARRAQMNLGQ